MLFLATAVALSACAFGPQITRVQKLSPDAVTPYQTVLVIGLFKRFDVRRKFEKEMVRQLAERGTKAVASTSMMDTTTPVTRATFLAQVEKIGADGVLVSQLASIESKAAAVDRNPQATYNVRPTYYYNVWSVNLTEYVEPPGVEVSSDLLLATEIFDVRRMEPVWMIEGKSKIVTDISQPGYYPFIPDEVQGIVRYLSRDGLIAR